jgi:peroxiredoxin
MGDDQPAERPNIPRVGAVAPDFQLANTSQQTWHLAARVRTRPTILLFYRGYW